MQNQCTSSLLCSMKPDIIWISRYSCACVCVCVRVSQGSFVSLVTMFCSLQQLQQIFILLKKHSWFKWPLKNSYVRLRWEVTFKLKWFTDKEILFVLLWQPFQQKCFWSAVVRHTSDQSHRSQIKGTLKSHVPDLREWHVTVKIIVDDTVQPHQVMMEDTECRRMFSTSSSPSLTSVTCAQCEPAVQGQGAGVHGVLWQIAFPFHLFVPFEEHQVELIHIIIVMWVDIQEV